MRKNFTKKKMDILFPIQKFIVLIAGSLISKSQNQNNRKEFINNMRQIEIQRPYMHFKGKLYYVHNIITHTEEDIKLVSYQALYPPYKMYARPLEMFLEEVEEGRVDNVTNQKYRFELYEG